jgi:hypothetical protein
MGPAVEDRRHLGVGDRREPAPLGERRRGLTRPPPPLVAASQLDLACGSGRRRPRGPGTLCRPGRRCMIVPVCSYLGFSRTSPAPTGLSHFWGPAGGARLLLRCASVTERAAVITLQGARRPPPAVGLPPW